MRQKLRAPVDEIDTTQLLKVGEGVESNPEMVNNRCCLCEGAQVEHHWTIQPEAYTLDWSADDGSENRLWGAKYYSKIW